MTLYTERDINIPLDIESDSGFELSDIQDLEVKLVRGSVNVIKTLNNGVEQIGDQLYLRINPDDLTYPGDYKVQIKLTDFVGEVHGITPDKDVLTIERSI